MYIGLYAHVQLGTGGTVAIGKAALAILRRATNVIQVLGEILTRNQLTARAILVTTRKDFNLGRPLSPPIGLDPNSFDKQC